ncbi:LTA synthase family protein [Shewanella sp. SM74]|uniref:LTA synthase family protein n=1 Tax=Shewanella sp. SM74 TaxID=2912807 RepID=UPI0021D85C0F|nr:LTA synthase family protein [Shewanella sp. SM74]MCU8014399.1 LTA synthase family protein [Shewanella sp. SM74]
MRPTLPNIYATILISLIPFIGIKIFNFPTSYYSTIDTFSLSLLIFITLKLSLYISKLVYVVIATTITFMILTFYSISIEFFKFYDTYISYDGLALFNDLISAARNFTLKKPLIYISLITLSTFFLSCLVQKIKFKKNNSLVIIFAIFTFILLTSIHNDRYFFQKMASVYSGQSATVIESFENPLMTMFRSTPIISRLVEEQSDINATLYNDLLSKKMMDNSLDKLPEEYSLEKYKDIIPEYPGYKQLVDYNQPLLAIPQKKLKPNNKNIILIVMESFRMYERGKNIGEIELTPNINNIAKESLDLTNFYSTNRTTVKSELAILCGLPEISKISPFSITAGSLRGNCAPKILLENGYETIWFHGHSKKFFNRENFHPSLGFSRLYSKESFVEDGYDEKNDIGWGVPDRILFKKAIDSLKEIKKPFFAEILTLSNHQPFNWNFENDSMFSSSTSYSGDDIYKNYLKGINYSDYSLGNFFRDFKKSELFNNTILIITGDHGVPFYDNDNIDERLKSEILYKVPLLIYSKDLKHKVDTNIYSHLDIAPTILSLLNIREPNSFLGRAIMGIDKTTVPRPIFLMNKDSYGFKFYKLSCLENYQKCNETEYMNKVMEQSKSLFHYLNISQNAGYPLFPENSFNKNHKKIK